MGVKMAAALLLLITLGARADFQWTVGGDGMSCTDACGAENPCLASVSIASVADFQTILASVFPANSYPCDGTQAGDIAYDPSTSDYYCGWKTDAPGSAFSCEAEPPKTTRRFCPCGTTGSVVASAPQETETNLENVNPPDYRRWKKGASLAATPAPAPQAAAPTSAPVAPVPLATAPPPPIDTNLAGVGSDYYSIVNSANDRALYALAKPMEGTDGTDSKGLGASHDWEGSADQDWRIRAAGMQDGEPVFRIINDVCGRRLYANQGIDGIDGKMGFGATDSTINGPGELWFIIEVQGDGHDTRFKIKNALSKRYIFANSNVNDGEGFGATANPEGKNIEWGFRVQSRTIVDKSIVELFHHSATDGPDGTTQFCVVSSGGAFTSGGATLSCDGSGQTDDYAKFKVGVIDPTIPSFTLKSVGVNKYCTPGPSVTCTADVAGEAQAFSVEKRTNGAVVLKGGMTFCYPSATGIGCSAVPPTDSDLFEFRCADNCAKITTIEEYDLGGKLEATNDVGGVFYFCGIAFAVLGMLAFVYRRQQHSAGGESHSRELETGQEELLVE